MGNESSAVESSQSSSSLKSSARPLYQLRVLVQGERSCGKSSLVRLLRGEPFAPNYVPTQQIEATALDWCFKSTNEQVRVEVWDVVDQAKKSAKAGGPELKLSFDNASAAKRGAVNVAPVDAENVNVYRGAHAVFAVFDPRKAWTVRYVTTLAQSPNLPASIHLLALASFRDEPGERATAEVNELRGVLQKRPLSHFLECSCRDGFGKTAILNFLNIPFLQLQRDHLTQLLERNARDSEVATQEFEMLAFEQDYEAHLKWANAKPVPKASPSPTPTPPRSTSPVPKKESPGPEKSPAKVVAPVKVPAKMPSAKPPALMEEEEDLDGFLHDKKEDDGWGATIESDDDSSDNELVAGGQLPKKQEINKPAPKTLPPTAAAVPAKPVAQVQPQEQLSKAVAPAPVAQSDVGVSGKGKEEAKPVPVEHPKPAAAEQPKKEVANVVAAAAVVDEKPNVPKQPVSSDTLSQIEVPIEDDLDDFFEKPTPVAPKKDPIAPPPSSAQPAVAMSLDSDDDNTEPEASAASAPVVAQTKAPAEPAQGVVLNDALAAVLEEARRVAEEQAAAAAAAEKATSATSKPGKKKKGTTKKKTKKAEPTAAPSRKGDYTSF